METNYNNTNTFHLDNSWQRDKRDKFLKAGFYGRYSQEGRYVFVDKGRLSTQLQKRFAVDTIAQARNGEALCIEEKIVRWPGYRYTAYALETDSCTRPDYESPGWMDYGQADFLLYCFEQEDGSLECHWIDFQKLKLWFWSRVDTFRTFGPLNTMNGTMGKIVPIVDVERSVGVRKFMVGVCYAAEEGEGKEGDQRERPRDGSGGSSAEAGGSGGDAAGGKVAP